MPNKQMPQRNESKSSNKTSSSRGATEADAGLARKQNKNESEFEITGRESLVNKSGSNRKGSSRS